MALNDPETCSWCTEEVEDSLLSMTRDGARICPKCRNTDEGQKAVFWRHTDTDIEHSLMSDTEKFFE